MSYNKWHLKTNDINSKAARYIIKSSEKIDLINLGCQNWIDYFDPKCLDKRKSSPFTMLLTLINYLTN